MANYPQVLAQDAVCQSHTGHMTGLWFLPARPIRLNANEWMNDIYVFLNGRFRPSCHGTGPSPLHARSGICLWQFQSVPDTRAQTSDCEGCSRSVPDGSYARFVSSKKEIYFLPSWFQKVTAAVSAPHSICIFSRIALFVITLRHLVIAQCNKLDGHFRYLILSALIRIDILGEVNPNIRGWFFLTDMVGTPALLSIWRRREMQSLTRCNFNRRTWWTMTKHHI